MSNGPKTGGFEDETGIHFVADRAAPKGQRREVCIMCRGPATCCARLYVPCSKLAIRQVDDVSALMAGVYFCDRHFYALNAQEFVAGDRNKPVRESIEQHFKQLGSHPNFDQAVIGRIPLNDPDFARGQGLVDKARRS